MTAGRTGRSVGLHVATVVSRFPKFTETFVTNEILAFQRAGVTVDVYPLLPPEPLPHQPVAVPLVAEAHYGPLFAPRSLGSLLRWTGRRPIVMARIVARLIAETWRNPRFMLKDLILLPRIAAVADDLLDREVTHVHAHFATHAGFAVWVVNRLTALPYSIVAHGSDVHRHQAMLATKVAGAAFVATVSEYNRRVIRSVSASSDSKKVEVVRVGVDLAGIDEVVAETTNQPNVNSRFVACVGTLHEVKGQRYLLEAVARLVRAGYPVRVELIGGGPDRADLERLVAELGIAEFVDFLGPVGHRDVIGRVAHAAVVVAPSVASTDGRKEGIPTVLIEAMAVGTPVVASDLAGIGELIEDGTCGLLVPPRDSAALAEAIMQLLDDHDRRDRMIRAARHRVESEFDIRATTARMLELIEGARGR